nr:efflux RND transporter periplasmic adaptor subunit [Kofleriaceae bacterium]
MRRFLPLILLAAIAGVYVGYRIYLSRQPFRWDGTVEARSITVGSRVGGRIAKILVAEGAAVGSGQELVELEPGDLPAQRLYAKAELDQASAALAKLVAGSRPEEIAAAKARSAQAEAALAEARHGSRAEDVAAAQARLAAAQAAVDNAKLVDDRAHKLLATQAIAQSESDSADSALRAATGERDAQQKVLDELVAGQRPEDKAQAAARAAEATASAKLVEAGARVEDIKAAQAQVDAATARVQELDVAIGELVIRAPAAARVEALDLRPGDILAPNAPAATLLEDGQLYVRIYVPETEIGRVQVGETVPIAVDSFPGTQFAGKVEHIDVVGEYSPRNLQTADERADQVFAMRVGLVEGKDVLRAGMAAEIQVAK